AKDVSCVSDSTGIGYSAASPPEAVDGYLRLKGICTIREIKVEGQSRISMDAIRFRIKTMPGSILHQKAVRKDIEEIYAMGYFETCDATYDHEVLTFTVKEYPIILSLDVKGNTEIKTDELLKSISMKKFDILNTKTLKTSMDRIVSLYREKGYFNAEVTSVKTAVEGGINLVFEVKENTQLYVKEVSFDGNKHISSRKINGTLGFGGILETKSRWWFGMFGHAGSYVEETLDTDLLRIEQLYGDEGYVNARAGRPIVDIRQDKGIYITIPIEEGPLFTIGSIDITGDLIKPKEELMISLGIKPGDIMSKSKVHKAVEILRDFYMDAGFAYAQVRPDMKEETATTIGINFMIKQGKPVHVETIYIRGNSKTRDKVIRREFKINEGDLYSSKKLQESKDGLNRLGYFKGVNVDTIPKSDETMSMLVDVEETTTGAFSFGFAYSSLDRLMGTIQLSESNLFGYGLKTKLSAEYGGKRKSYALDFEEPWLLD
ncbi:outer membrane protein assembly factor BamA, partial [archaeon]|nr:outer membrane protein assembly factor BamA [archaeon]